MSKRSEFFVLKKNRQKTNKYQKLNLNCEISQSDEVGSLVFVREITLLFEIGFLLNHIITFQFASDFLKLSFYFQAAWWVHTSLNLFSFFLMWNGAFCLFTSHTCEQTNNKESRERESQKPKQLKHVYFRLMLVWLYK